MHIIVEVGGRCKGQEVQAGMSERIAAEAWQMLGFVPHPSLRALAQ
jgi:hypothetical protein